MLLVISGGKDGTYKIYDQAILYQLQFRSEE